MSDYDLTTRALSAINSSHWMNCPWRLNAAAQCICGRLALGVEVEEAIARAEAAEAALTLAQVKLDAAEKRNALKHQMWEEVKAKLDAVAKVAGASGLTRLQCDYVGQNDGSQPEGWRIHDFPAEPNPHGAYFAHYVAGGMVEAEALAIVEIVNAALGYEVDAAAANRIRTALEG